MTPSESQREDQIDSGKLPAGFEPDGRDEDLETGDLVHPTGSGPHGHTTPPGTSIPDEKQSDEPSI